MSWGVHYKTCMPASVSALAVTLDGAVSVEVWDTGENEDVAVL